MDIPSLFMIPSAVSSGKVHSVFPNSTDADFDFNRDSSATRVNSQGLIETVGYFGSELITNGDFSSGSSGWTLSTTPPELRGNNFLFNSSSNFIFRSWSNVSGRTYRINFQGTGDLRYRTGFSGSDGTIREISLPTIVEFEATSNTNRIQIYGATSGTGVLDSVSIKEVTGDRARLNYEIEGGLVNTKPSLLLEPQSTNLVTYSQDYTQSVWNKENITVTSNAVISPDGTKNASILTDTSTNGQHRITTSALFSADGNNRVFSVFVKKGTSRYCAINHVAGFTSSVNTVIFDFDTASYVATGRSDYIDEVFTAKHYGNGWYKIAFRSDLNTAAYNRLSIGLSNGTSYTDTNYAGTGATVFVWGGQVEQQSYCTSYIPTNGSTQTRAAETCNGAGTSSIFESTEGILYAEYASLGNDGSVRYLGLSDGSSSNRAVILNDGTTNNIRGIVSSGGTKYADFGFVVSDVTTFNKVALKWKANDFQLWINGVKRAEDSAGLAPIGLDRFGFDLAGSGPIDAKIRDIRVYNTKEMTDSEVDILLTKITS